MQNAQEVLNNSHISEHMPYSVPFVEGNSMEPPVGDGLLHNSKFQNIQHEAGRDAALDGKHTLDSAKINTVSLDADNNIDLQEHRFSANAVLLDANAKNNSHLNEATVTNHSSSGSDNDGKYDEKSEMASEMMYGKDPSSQMSGDSEYESKLLQRNEATLDIPAFNPVPRNWSVMDDLQPDGNLVSPTLTPVLPSSSVIEPMVTPDYSTSPSYSNESLPLSSSSSSAKQETPEMSNFYSCNESSETLLSSPFFAKGSVPADASGSMSSSSLLQTNSMTPLLELSSKLHKTKEAQELNEDDTLNQNSVLLETNLPSSNDVLEDSDKIITPDVGNVAKILSETPSESIKASGDTTQTLENHTDSSLTLKSSSQDKISESITPVMPEVKNIEDNSDVTTDDSYSEISSEVSKSNEEELKQSTEILEPTNPEGGVQNVSDASSNSEVNLLQSESNSLIDESFEVSKSDNVATFQGQMSGDIAKDHSEKMSPKDDFQDEISVETKTTVPEETQRENVLLETASVAQNILCEEVEALDSGFQSKCETEVKNSVNTVGASETDSQDGLAEDHIKFKESEITDKQESHLEKSAAEIVGSAIEAAVQIKKEQEDKEKKDAISKIDLKRHFTSQNITYVVIAAAIFSTTLILVNRFWK